VLDANPLDHLNALAETAPVDSGRIACFGDRKAFELRAVSVLPKMWRVWHRHVAESVLSILFLWGAAQMAFAIGVFILVIAGTTIIGAMVLSLTTSGNRHQRAKARARWASSPQ
jgi:hypothetical protein